MMRPSSSSTVCHERVAIFIDGANLISGIKHVLGDSFKYDIFKLVQFLKGSRYLLRAYYYDGIYPYPQSYLPKEDRERFLEERKKKMDFIHLLRGSHITPQLSELKILKVRGEWVAVQKGVDVQLAMDSLILAFRNAYDIALLVSGDGDLANLARELKYLGKQVEVAAFREIMADALMDEADRLIFLEEHVKEFDLYT